MSDSIRGNVQPIYIGPTIGSVLAPIRARYDSSTFMYRLFDPTNTDGNRIIKMSLIICISLFACVIFALAISIIARAEREDNISTMHLVAVASGTGFAIIDIALFIHLIQNLLPTHLALNFDVDQLELEYKFRWFALANIISQILFVAYLSLVFNHQILAAVALVSLSLLCNVVGGAYFLVHIWVMLAMPNMNGLFRPSRFAVVLSTILIIGIYISLLAAGFAVTDWAVK